METMKKRYRCDCWNEPICVKLNQLNKLPFHISLNVNCNTMYGTRLCSHQVYVFISDINICEVKVFILTPEVFINTHLYCHSKFHNLEAYVNLLAALKYNSLTFFEESKFNRKMLYTTEIKRKEKLCPHF